MLAPDISKVQKTELGRTSKGKPESHQRDGGRIPLSFPKRTVLEETEWTGVRRKRGGRLVAGEPRRSTGGDPEQRPADTLSSLSNDDDDDDSMIFISGTATQTHQIGRAHV